MLGQAKREKLLAFTQYPHNPLILEKGVILKDLLSQMQLLFSREMICPNNVAEKASGAVPFIKKKGQLQK